MTKRLQVLLDDDDLRAIQRLARLERQTTAEWVRQRLRQGVEDAARPDTATRLAAIHAAYRLRPSDPSPDIEQMLAEIEDGYLEGGATT